MLVGRLPADFEPPPDVLPPPPPPPHAATLTASAATAAAAAPRRKSILIALFPPVALFRALGRPASATRAAPGGRARQWPPPRTSRGSASPPRASRPSPAPPGTA